MALLHVGGAGAPPRGYQGWRPCFKLHTTGRKNKQSVYWDRTYTGADGEVQYNQLSELKTKEAKKYKWSYQGLGANSCNACNPTPTPWREKVPWVINTPRKKVKPSEPWGRGAPHDTSEAGAKKGPTTRYRYVLA